MSDRIPTGPLLETRDLVKRLRAGGREVVIIDRLNLAVRRDEVVAILGPSGSGKSTLLGLLAGLDQPTSGSVLFEGHALESLSQEQLADLRRKNIGFVFQSFRLLPRMTALDNVLIAAELAGVAAPRRRASELLVAVGLEARALHYPSQLSGGEQQRVALARAFAAEPKLLLADEPTGNLDRATGAAVLAILQELRARHHTTMVVVTHDHEVADLADRRIHLLDGKIERIEPNRL